VAAVGSGTGEPVSGGAPRPAINADTRTSPDARTRALPGDHVIARVLVIDDHELFSTALAMALCQHGFDAHQVAPTSLDAVLAAARRLAPGLAVLDLCLDDGAAGSQLTGLDLVAPLRSIGWTVLVITGNRDRPGEAAAIASGAICAVRKSTGFDDLLQIVETAAAGKPVMSEAERGGWLTLHIAYQAERRAVERRLATLTAREREVLALLADGNRAGSIAETLVVSMATVRAQIRTILAKLEVNSQLEAVALVHQRLSRSSWKLRWRSLT
jgi:DNA-binding NarL/FixJ family response regulator